MERKIDTLGMAKLSINALLNYNKCDKHCEIPDTKDVKHACCCHKDCISKSQGDSAFTMDDVNDGIEFILDYFKKVGREMSE